MPFRSHSWIAVLALLALATPVMAQCVDYSEFAHLVGRETMAFSMKDLVADDNHAYAIAWYQGVIVINIDDPTHPQFLSNVALPSNLESLVQRDQMIFTVGNGTAPGVYAVDVSSPTSPTEVGYLAIPDGAQFVATHGDLLLVQRHLADIVDIIDASDPSAMTVLASFPIDGQAILSSGGDLIYARSRTHFVVWDLTDPTSPQPRGNIELSSTYPATSLVLQGSTILLPENAGISGVGIIDVADPDAPVLTGQIDTRYYVDMILMDGELLYITLNSGAVDIVNVADLADPIFLGSLVGGASSGTALSGHHLLGANYNSFSVFDMTGAHLAYPTIGNYNWGWGFSYSAERHGDHVYLGSTAGLQVFDVTDYTTPLNTFGAHSNASVAMHGDILYVGHSDGLTVYDLVDPAVPGETMTLDQPWWPGAPDLAVSEDLLVAGIGDSLVTFDLSTPSNPQRLGGRAFEENVVKVDGGLVYVLTDSLLYILDLADPVSLPELGHTYQPNGEDLAVGNGHAYVCYYPVGDGVLWVMDVSDPTQPTATQIYQDIYLRGLSLHGDQLLGTQGGWGVQLMDISDPNDLAYSGHLYQGYDVGWAYRAKVLGDLVWVGSDEGVAFLPAPCADILSPVDGSTTVPRHHLRLSSYPNPFNPRVEIRFELPQRGVVEVAVFDLRGRRVKLLATSMALDAGPHRWSWNGDDDAGRPLASGTYVARVRSGGRQATHKMLLVR